MADMYTLFTYRTATDKPVHICCKFPYAQLEQFKAAVPRDDRFWMPPLGTWVLSIHGANCLLDALPNEMAGLTWDVVCALVPARMDVGHVDGFNAKRGK
jgi:hypothetical protein